MKNGGRQSEMMKVLWVVPRWTAWDVLEQWMIVAGIDCRSQGTWNVVSSNLLPCITAINSLTLEAEEVSRFTLARNLGKGLIAWGKLIFIPHVPAGSRRSPPWPCQTAETWETRSSFLLFPTLSPFFLLFLSFFLLILTNSPSFYCIWRQILKRLLVKIWNV